MSSPRRAARSPLSPRARAARIRAAAAATSPPARVPRFAAAGEGVLAAYAVGGLPPAGAGAASEGVLIQFQGLGEVARLFAKCGRSGSEALPHAAIQLVAPLPASRDEE